MKQVPQTEIHHGPLLGDPPPAPPSPFQAQMKSFTEMAGPFWVSGQEIEESPVGDAHEQVPRRVVIPGVFKERLHAVRRRRQGHSGFQEMKRPNLVISAPEQIEKTGESCFQIAVAAHADHQDVHPFVPEGSRRMDDDPARPGKGGIGEGVPAPVQVLNPAVVGDVADQDQVGTRKVPRRKRVGRPKRDVTARFVPQPLTHPDDPPFHRGRIDNHHRTAFQRNGEDPGAGLEGKCVFAETVTRVIGISRSSQSNARQRQQEKNRHFFHDDTRFLFHGFICFRSQEEIMAFAGWNVNPHREGTEINIFV